MLEWIENINTAINNFVWGPVMIALILMTGLILTIRLKFIQVSKFGDSCKNTIGKVFKKDTSEQNKNGISQFQAFSAAIAGTVGTGNIVGVATALVSGGAGAIFWMWISAFFGMATNFSENVLGIYYRKSDGKDSYNGGPMYYISEGLKWKKVAKVLAIAFACFCVLASFGYNMTQSNSISSALDTTFSIPTWVTGVILCIIVALVVVGGIQRIGKIASYIVPFMAVIFILIALITIFANVKTVPYAFQQIFSNAFSIKSVGGGIMGYTVMRAMRYGLARGIFSNEAGLGSSVMAHSASNVKEPVQQGFWGIFEVFLDTFVICTLMAIMLISTGAYGTVGANGALVDGAPLASIAFSATLGKFGEVMFAVILPLFAFTTILSWSFYGEKAIEYLFGRGAILPYKIIYLMAIVLGSVTQLELVWAISDTFNGLMAIPNLISLLLLSGELAKVVKNYFARRKDPSVAPLLSAYDALPDVPKTVANTEAKSNKE